MAEIVTMEPITDMQSPSGIAGTIPDVEDEGVINEDLVHDLSGTLTVTIHQARGLKSLSRHFHMSPFASISLPPYVSNTEPAIKEDVSPHWNSTHTFTLAHSASESVVVTLIDQVTNTQICRWFCPLGELVQPLYSEAQWLPLFNFSDPPVASGELELSVSWNGSPWRQTALPLKRFTVVSDSHSQLSTDSVESDTSSHHDSLNSTASTEKADSIEEGVVDRRSLSSTPPLSTSSDSPVAQYSQPLPDDTFVTQNDRHVSTYIPALTNGAPFIHSSGRHGLLYDDTTYFDDRNFLQNSASVSSICEVRVWSRDFIHGIQVVYALGNGHQETPRYMGKVHTTMHTMKIDHSHGEFIIGVEGTYKEWLETLTITTNKRTKTFGGNVDSRPKRWMPAGSKPSPVTFRCDVPPGHRVVGFHGGYGVHIHNIGVFYQPISEDDRKKKHSCLFKSLRKRFSRTKLNC